MVRINILKWPHNCLLIGWPLFLFMSIWKMNSLEFFHICKLAGLPKGPGSESAWMNQIQSLETLKVSHIKELVTSSQQLNTSSKLTTSLQRNLSNSTHATEWRNSKVLYELRVLTTNTAEVIWGLNANFGHRHPHFYEHPPPHIAVKSIRWSRHSTVLWCGV